MLRRELTQSRRVALRRSSDDDAYEYEDEVEEGDGAPAAPARDVEPPAAPAAQAPAAAPPAAASGRARASRATEFSRNGGAADGYLWSQSDTEVTVSALVPPGTRARDVQVRLSAPPRPAGVPAGPAEPPVLRITLAGVSEPVLQAALAHAVEAPGGADAEADGECDWELTDFDADTAGEPPRRAVRVTLRKTSPGGAVVHWWARALAGGPAIDTSAIVDRGRTAARTAAAREAWAEAEAQFKSRTREFQRVEVDVGDGSGGGDDDDAA